MTSSGRGTPARLPSRARDRRPALAALAILLVLLGALGSALIAYRSGDRIDVLVAARDIPQGTQVSADDFTVARVAHEGGSVIPLSASSNFIGTYALGRIPTGALVAPTMFTVQDILPEGGQLVGVTVQSSYRPAQGLDVGDVVEVYAVPEQGTGGEASVLVSAARVVHLAPGDARDALHLTILVPDADASTVVSFNAYGQVALTELPSDATPLIDLITP